MGKYSVKDLIEQYLQTGRGWSGEDFCLYRRPLDEPEMILDGATKLPCEDEALSPAIERWCRALTELRRSVPDADWHVHVDDLDVHWDQARQVLILSSPNSRPYPTHWATGCGRYFGNRQSFCDNRHRRNREPFAETTSFLWAQVSQRLSVICCFCCRRAASRSCRWPRVPIRPQQKDALQRQPKDVQYRRCRNQFLILEDINVGGEDSDQQENNAPSRHP